MRSLLILLLFSLQAGAFELSDVSLLLPLNVSRSFFKPSDLISAQAMAALPQPIYDESKATSFRDSFRVVGVRFDPCFFEGTGPVVCRSMVRLVWQPVVMRRGQLTTRDAALHSFYDFSPSEFASLMKSYSGLLAAYPAVASGPLDVNPRFQSPAFVKALYSLLAQHLDQNHLTRVTMMTLEKGENDWKFLGFNIENGRPSAIPIAQVGVAEQRLITLKPNGFVLRAMVTPDAHSAGARLLFRDSDRVKSNLAEVSAELALEQNPRLSNPGTIACASCHMSEPGAQLLRLRGAWVPSYSSSRDLSNTTLQNLQPRRFRAFGYFDSKPLFAQRTINESAEVADALERLLQSKN